MRSVLAVVALLLSTTGCGHDAAVAGDAAAAGDAAVAGDAAAAGDAASADPLPPVFERDGTHYERAWVEEFDHGLGEATLGDWTFATNAAWLHPDNARVADDMLELHLTAVGATQLPPGADRDYLGAEYDRIGAQQFGRLLTRMRPAAPPGVISSFFTAAYRYDGAGTLVDLAEIDIEFAGKTTEVQFTIHWIDAAGQQSRSATVALPFDAGADFHVWEIEWLAGRIVFYVDGDELHRFTDPTPVAEQAQPQSVMANTWITTSVPWAGAFDPGTLPQVTRYDWMASYRVAP